VSSPPIQGLEDMKVRGYDHIFCARDSAIIKSMPIQFSKKEDNLIWHYSKDGIYSVKSAYYQAMESSIDNSTMKIGL